MLCRFMRWSWADYLNTPADVIDAAILLYDDEARAQHRAAQAMKTTRRR